MNPTLPFHSRRSPVYSLHGMVACTQPLAAAAGLSILAQGGNAADAAVATAAALNVTEPASTGIGGDAFMLYYEAKTGIVHALNGSGRAPQALTLERIRQAGIQQQIPDHHPYAVTVPGACAAWCDTVQTLGKLSMVQVLAPAIRLAEEGFPVSPLSARSWRSAAENVLASSPNGLELTLHGRGPADGELFRNPALAQTFRQVAEGGKEAFYQGAIAEKILDTLQKAGGCMSEDDLATHQCTWELPISTIYRDWRIWECPPNGQGLTALIALNILEGFDLSALPALSTQRLHIEIEAMRLAFADTRRYIADPEHTSIPVDELLSKAYAAQRRKEILLERANPAIQAGNPLAKSDTVYLSVVDGEGNACSFINSLYMGFGSGIVPSGSGFALHNRGCNFSLEETHPNCAAPMKRPYHTIIPALATRVSDGSLAACFGVMGGFMQPQGHMQVVSALLDDQLNPQDALDQPRFCIQQDLAHSEVLLEDGIALETMAQLAELGHRVTPVSGYRRGAFGRGQIILRDAQSGVLTAGSDPRGDGCAMPVL